MKISLNWLKRFIEIPKNITPEELGLALTLKTTEVEAIEKQGKYLENVVVGKIAKIETHPNANKLKVCFVDIGEKENLQVVCGGNNLREGMSTAVAKIGAKVKWHGEEEVTIEKTKVRGVESCGMICTSSEIGLEEIITQKDEREIVDLEKIPLNPPLRKGENIGKSLAEFLGLDDVIFEIDNKSITNRPDLWSHYGMAREVAAIFGLKLSEKIPLNPPFSKGEKKEVRIDVEVRDKDLCPRYMALAISGIKIEPSPQWMQNRLSAVGMRPINNIVDITNFVMLELGQPMHAFDISKLKSSVFAEATAGKQKSKVGIIVRRAEQGEKIKTLDGVERKLDGTMLVIADEAQAIAIAGIMGGENSEIDENTTEIILESANFEKVNNRKTSAKLGLRSEAVMRYEKGLDPVLTEKALARYVELIKEIIPEAKIFSDVVAVGIEKFSISAIEVSLDYIRKKMGVEIKEKKVVDILESLGFVVKKSKGEIFKINVPSWRATGDINIPDDIVEEVARIYGYDDIMPQMPEVKLEPVLKNKERNFERRIKNVLSLGFGMAETYNYSFVNEKQIENSGMNADECLKLINPLSSEHTLLRPSLIPNLLENVKNNLRYFDKFKMFEIGSIFKNEKGEFIMKDEENEFLPWQEKFIAGIVADGKNAVPFYKAKEIAEGLLDELGIDYDIVEDDVKKEWAHPYRIAKFQILNFKFQKEVGYIAELNPAIAKNIGIKNARVAIFEFGLKFLFESAVTKKKYRELPKYPAVIRDLAIVIDKKILYRDIVKIISGIDPLIKSVELFDIFESEKLGADKKSMAFRIIFKSDERTLTDGEVEKIFSDIVRSLEKKSGAEIRS